MCVDCGCDLVNGQKPDVESYSMGKPVALYYLSNRQPCWSVLLVRLDVVDV